MLAVALSDLQLDCSKCTAEMKADRGCEQDSPIPGRWRLRDFEFDRCPVKLVSRQSADYLRAYGFYNKGFLPSPGSWLEQGAKFVEAIEIIEVELARMDEEKAGKVK